MGLSSEEKDRRKEARVPEFIDGRMRLVSTDPDCTHGKAGGATNWYCGCTPCRNANAAAQRARTDKKRRRAESQRRVVNPQEFWINWDRDREDRL